MRKIASKELANKLIEDIPSIEILSFDDDKTHEDKYKEVMHRYDCKEWIKVIKTAHLIKKERSKSGRKVAAIDDRYLKMAQEYLIEEFAISLDISGEKVKEFIVKQLKYIES